MLVQNNIYNNSESYAILLFSMWPVLIVLLVVISCAFYGVLMHKTAICFFCQPCSLVSQAGFMDDHH